MIKILFTPAIYSNTVLGGVVLIVILELIVIGLIILVFSLPEAIVGLVDGTKLGSTTNTLWA